MTLIYYTVRREQKTVPRNRHALHLTDKCDLKLTLLSFIIKCENASKVKTTLGMLHSDWLKHVILKYDYNFGVTSRDKLDFN